MLARKWVRHILDDDALTRCLGDPEARLLVEWLVEQAEQLAEDATAGTIEHLWRRGRAISRFVALWCYEQAPAGAMQLAASERFTWPLPIAADDPCGLMQSILSWEGRYSSAWRRPRNGTTAPEAGDL